MYTLLERYDLALADADSALELDPNQPFAYSTLISIHASVSEYRDCDLVRFEFAHLLAIDQNQIDVEWARDIIERYCSE
jgi:hypothetical protein